MGLIPHMKFNGFRAGNPSPCSNRRHQPSNESESSAENALEYSELTVGALKEKLKELGLPISGKKSDLVERLTASDQKETDQSLDNENDDEDDSKPLFSTEELESLSRTQLRELRKKYHKEAEVLRIKEMN